MATMGYWFDWVAFAGAAYLVWLGLKLIAAPVVASMSMRRRLRRAADFPAGFLWCCLQPKVLCSYARSFRSSWNEQGTISRSSAARSPSWSPARSPIRSTTLLAGRARLFFSARRTRLLSRISGGFMIGRRRLAGLDAAR